MRAMNTAIAIIHAQAVQADRSDRRRGRRR
jgi:hypothetical protein